MGAIISPRDRGRYSGYMGAVMAVATVCGPLLGGVIVDSSLGWRWCFYVCVPLALIALFVLQATLHVATVRRAVRRSTTSAPSSSRSPPACRCSGSPSPATTSPGSRGRPPPTSAADRPRRGAGRRRRASRSPSRSCRCGSCATAPPPWSSSPASPSASRCSAARPSSASTSRSPAATPRPQAGLLTIPLMAGHARLLHRSRPDHQPHRTLEGVPRRRRDLPRAGPGRPRHPGPHHAAVAGGRLHGASWASASAR